MFLINFLIGLALAQQPAESITTESDQSSSQGSQYQVTGQFAFEARDNKIAQANPATSPYLQNFSLAASFTLSAEHEFYGELLGEQNNDNTQVSVGELYAKYSPQFYQQVQLRLGNMYYRHGVLVGQEGILSRRPAFYSDLLVSRRGIDLGGEIQWQPLSSLPLTFAASIFAGRTVRAGDQNLQPASIMPKVFTMTYSHRRFQLKANYLFRQYQGAPRFEAFGASVQAEPIYFFKSWLAWAPFAEVWSMNYQRPQLAQRQSLVFLAGHKVNLKYFYYRWLHAQENWQGGGLESLQNSFELNGLGLDLGQYFAIEWQNIRARESQSSFTGMNINEDVYRLLINF